MIDKLFFVDLAVSVLFEKVEDLANLRLALGGELDLAVVLEAESIDQVVNFFLGAESSNVDGGAVAPGRRVRRRHLSDQLHFIEYVLLVGDNFSTRVRTSGVLTIEDVDA